MKFETKINLGSEKIDMKKRESTVLPLMYMYIWCILTLFFSQGVSKAYVSRNKCFLNTSIVFYKHYRGVIKPQYFQSF